VCMCERNTRRGICPFCLWSRWGKGRCERTRRRQWLPRGQSRVKDKNRTGTVSCNCGIAIKCVANKDLITNKIITTHLTIGDGAGGGVVWRLEHRVNHYPKNTEPYYNGQPNEKVRYFNIFFMNERNKYVTYVNINA